MITMMPLNSSRIVYLFAIILALATVTGCVPVETRPTLNEVRLGQGHGILAGDPDLRPGETRAEVLEVIPARSEIRVRTDDGREHIMIYNTTRTSVTYHGWDYTVENLESGDRIAFQTAPRNGNYVEAIRVQEPVQARTGPVIARPLPPPARSNVIEGTVERIQYDRGIFDLRTRSNELFTVSLPYSARAADVESFRRLRTGDYVRLEGEFINRDNLQVYSFLTPR
jgi:hypothetical protein